jgi:SNF2 family DNA or RNA helicase
VGLNLTAADYVFILDPWWNEAVEEQAISRAHRMGRIKTVISRRYISKGTVEEQMLLMKENKQALADSLFS